MAGNLVSTRVGCPSFLLTKVIIRPTSLGIPRALKSTSPLRASSSPPGLQGQHQRKVKNTQIYEFYHFPKNGRMQCGF